MVDMSCGGYPAVDLDLNAGLPGSPLHPGGPPASVGASWVCAALKGVCTVKFVMLDLLEGALSVCLAGALSM